MLEEDIVAWTAAIVESKILHPDRMDHRKQYIRDKLGTDYDRCRLAARYGFELTADKTLAIINENTNNS